MSYCNLTLNDDGLWQCPDCKWVYKRFGPRRSPRRNCPNSPDLAEAKERLGISTDDMKHWAQALAKWTRAGFPKRSQAEVRQCLAICVQCENFVPAKSNCTGTTCRMKTGGRCKLCGCGVKSGGLAIFNKLAMKTEGCPKGKFEATA